MDKFQYGEKPIKVCRDCGPNLLEMLAPENRKKSRERVLDPNIVTGKYKLKELFGEIGIVVYPERMTMWYQFTE